MSSTTETHAYHFLSVCLSVSVFCLCICLRLYVSLSLSLSLPLHGRILVVIQVLSKCSYSLMFCLIHCLYIYKYRPLSSVQNKLMFVLHDPYDLSWSLCLRSLGENMYYCVSSIYCFKRKKIHYVIKFSFVFGLTDS